MIIRRFLATGLLVALTLSLTGCGTTPTASQPGPPMQVGKKDTQKKAGPPAPPAIKPID